MQYLLILIGFVYVLVTPTHVYESQAAAGALFFEKRRVFFEKARFQLPKPCLLRFRLAAGAFCFCFQTCFFVKKTHVLVVFLSFGSIVNQYWSIFVQYLSIFVNVRYCVRTYLLYGTAYCTVLRTYLPVPYFELVYTYYILQIFHVIHYYIIRVYVYVYMSMPIL